MKLISLYIENFGTLSRYSLEFADGITVIREPNGFGKTTLAEFIRAMFYGFPRKAKTLDKSKRQKYTPWNGGKCGGNLVFETDGQRYRIERTFGATPKADTFALIDLGTGKKSDRFSEEIGLELFRLDADSFERSTYMPQFHDLTSLTTDSIQAKLGDLVEDTNDVGNFDKAIAALRTKRSTFVPYRGSGGSVAEAVTEISRLQKELDQAQEMNRTLSQARQEAQLLEQELKEQEADIVRVREQIGKASEAAASAARREQYENLRAQAARVSVQLEQLRRKYPGGLPRRHETEQILQTADRAAALACQQVTTPEDRRAWEYLEENRSRFGSHLPTGQELDDCREWCERYLSLTAQAESAGLSETESGQYETLLPLYEAGALEEAALDDLTEKSRELTRGIHALAGLQMLPEDREKLAGLEAYFASGIPTEGTVRGHLHGLSRAEELRQENFLLTAGAPKTDSAPKPGSKGMIPVLLLGILGVLAGAALLILRQYVAGGVVLGVGLLALIGAMYLNLRQMITKGLAGGAVEPSQRLKMEENEAKAAQLERAAREFTEQYAKDLTPREALNEILDNREDLLALREKQKSMDQKRREQAAENENLRENIQRVLMPWAGYTADPEQALLKLRLDRSRFISLQAEKAAAERKKAALTEQARALEAELTVYLGSFFAEVSSDRFHGLLTTLQRDADAYKQAQAAVSRWQQRRQRHEQEVQTCAEELKAFFARYGLAAGENVRAQLQQLRDDEKLRQSLSQTEAELEQQIRAMREEKEFDLTGPEPEELPDLQQLQQEEKRLTQEYTVGTRNLLTRRQQISNLRLQADRIPEIQDMLDNWTARKNADQEKSKILDDTMDFLQKAKDNLSNSYLGPIRERFAGYMQRLMDEQGEKILVTPDLQVRLERQGQSREMAYFSAGQNDMVMLCMRFALVDALFRDQKPFVILDDPFVNLDDERTEQALALLRELGQQRQILYLVCNSSRTI